ncbi:MAG: hypothetical protein ACE3JN_00590, partial [Ectobacillus sp.]
MTPQNKPANKTSIDYRKAPSASRWSWTIRKAKPARPRPRKASACSGKSTIKFNRAKKGLTAKSISVFG